MGCSASHVTMSLDSQKARLASILVPGCNNSQLNPFFARPVLTRSLHMGDPSVWWCQIHLATTWQCPKCWPILLTHRSQMCHTYLEHVGSIFWGGGKKHINPKSSPTLSPVVKIRFKQQEKMVAVYNLHIGFTTWIFLCNPIILNWWNSHSYYHIVHGTLSIHIGSFENYPPVNQHSYESHDPFSSTIYLSELWFSVAVLV